MIWLGGLALLIGASVYSLAWIGFAFFGRDPTAPVWLPIHLLVIVGSIGIAAGLPSVQALQERQAGAMGLAATIMLVVGFLLAGVARQAVEAFTIPVMQRVPPGAELLVMVAGPLLFLGMLALGVAIIGAGVFPAWAGVWIIVAALLGAFAAYVPLPTALHMSITVVGSVILAYLGLLVMLESRG